MSGDNFADGKSKPRPVLGDITNRSVKRGFSLISDNLGFSSKEESDSQLAKQTCLGVENLIEEKSKRSQLEPNPNSSPACTVDLDTFNTKQVCLGVENLIREKYKRPQLEPNPTSLPACTVDLETFRMLVDDKVTEGKEGIGLSSDSEETLGQWEGATEGADPVNDNCRNEGEDLGIGRLASSKGGCIEWSRLPKTSSQSTRSFQLDRCGELKNDGCVNLNAGIDMLKACSCSFCLTAAFMWSDLHYQDIKGRISVLKKSQKEASILLQKYGRGKQTENQSQGNANKSSKLESDLTSQWKSLFLNMEDIFVQESSQLQASFIALNELRENCKMDLERITGMPSDK